MAEQGEAVLSITVDDEDAFDEVAENAERSAQATIGSYKRAARMVTQVWGQFFDFLKQGSDETRQRIERIEGSFDSLKSKIAEATAQSGPVSSLLRTMEEVLGVSQELPQAFEILGSVIGSLVTGPLGQMLMTAREIRNIAAGGTLGGVAVSDALIRMGNEAAARGLAAAGNIAAAQNVQFALRNRSAGGAAAGAGAGGGELRRGGGGGGGGGRGDAEMSFSVDEAEAAFAELQRQEQLYTDIVKTSFAERDALNVASYEHQRMLATDQAELQRSLEEEAIDRKRVETDAFMRQEQLKQQALATTLQALSTVATALSKGGPAAQAAGRVFMAVLAAISAQRAASALGQMFEALGRYDYGAAANFAAGAVQHGIAAGMQFSQALGGGGGGGGGRAAVGGRGGVVGPAAGGLGGAAGPSSVNRTYVIAGSGDLEVSDRALRRLARHIRDSNERGYD